MRLIPTALVFLLCSTLAAAQTTAYSVAVFGPSVTNPATASPVAPAVTYSVASVPCGQAKASETPQPIVNPYEGRFDDPVNVTKDCAVPIEAQILALAPGSGYTVAYRPVAGTTVGAWSPLSSTFTVAAQTAHPCDGVPPTSSTVLAGTRTLTWCHNGLDANGQPTTFSSWVAYIDTVRTVLSSVTVGTTANASGYKLYSAPVTLSSGTHVVQIAGVNTTGEAVKSASFTTTVSLPAAPPSAAVIRGIQ